MLFYVSFTIVNSKFTILWFALARTVVRYDFWVGIFSSYILAKKYVDLSRGCGEANKGFESDGCRFV